MKFNRPFTPGFIKKLDEKLLLNKPDSWSTRAHMVIYYCLLFMVVLAGICFIVPDDPRSGSKEPLWITLVCLLAFIGFIVWMIYLLRFNVFKRFGNLDQFNGLKTFLFYFISIVFMLLPPLVQPAVQSVRANMAYTGEELTKDMNAINSKVLLLEHDSIPHKWYADTFVVVNSLEGRQIAMEDENYIINSRGQRFRKILDTADFNRRAPEQDSVRQLNDSMFIFLECPEYMFVSNGDLLSYYPNLYLDSRELYYQYVLNYKAPEKKKTIDELRAILKKYNPRLEGKFAYESVDREWEYTNKIESKYGLYKVDMNINHITSRKYWWDGYTVPVLSRIIYYIALGLTLLVIVFRRTTVRTFFLTLLAAILITIITSLVLAFSGADSISVLILLLSYYAAFGILSFIMLGGRVRNVFNGISMNLFVFTTAFVPLIIVTLYYQILRLQYRDKPEPEGLFDNQLRDLLLGEIAGFVLLLLLMTLFFKRLYRAWYALPEQ